TAARRCASSACRRAPSRTRWRAPWRGSARTGMSRTRPEMELVGILTAMPEELAPIRARAMGLVSSRAHGHVFHRARRGGVRGAVGVGGDGPRSARRGADALLSTFPLTRLIGAGVAGALTPSLAVHSVLVDAEATDGDARRRALGRGALSARL